MEIAHDTPAAVVRPKKQQPEGSETTSAIGGALLGVALVSEMSGGETAAVVGGLVGGLVGWLAQFQANKNRR